jgi:hypothetical protein
MMLRSWLVRGVIPAMLVLLLISPSRANEGDVVVTGTRAPMSAVTGVDGKEVVLYGPFEPTPALRNAKGAIYVYIDGVSNGGKASSSELYVADAEKKSGGKLRLDTTDSTGSFATMEDHHAEPRQLHQSIHDYDVQGVPFQPFTHLKKLKKAMIVVVIRSGDVKYGRMIVSAHPPAEHRPGK